MGLSVGFSVGLSVGFSVGLSVGFSVGLSVGFSVGLSVGFNVGAVVGELLTRINTDQTKKNIKQTSFIICCKIFAFDCPGLIPYCGRNGAL